MVDLKIKAYELRKDIVNLIYNAGCGHIGGDLSVIDILVALYYKHLNCCPHNMDHPDRDRFVLSKGHAAEAIYCVLADRGFFPKTDLDNYSGFMSKYIGHPNNGVNGIEVNTGSLGHGLSVAVGMALAGKMDDKDYRVYTVLGDGELAEGSVWEGVMAGGHYKLDNLTAIVDRNNLQISGRTQDVMNQDRLEDRWLAFAWHVITIPGNDVTAIDRALAKAKSIKGKPTVIIANTTKGSGISFMENQSGWHHRVPNEQEYVKAMEELEAKLESFRRVS